MKTTRVSSWGSLLAVACLAGCGGEGATAPTQLTSPWLAMSGRGGEARSATRVLAEDTLELAGALHGALVEPDTNLLFSPHAITAALGMVQLGARGRTADQIARAAHFSLPPHELPLAFAAQRKALARLEGGPSDKITLAQANALWGAEGLGLLSAYQTGLSMGFDGAWHAAPFAASPGDARARINRWVAERTGGRIQDLVPAEAVTADTRLMLTSALYLAAPWARPFPRHAVRDGPFFTVHGPQTVAMMRLHLRAAYGASADFQAVELPYDGGSLSFMLLVPHDPDGDALDRLDGPELRRLVAGLAPRDVEVALPRFKASVACDLREALARLGVRDAFDAGAANFEGINGGRDLFIGNIQHRATIEVNEAGTHAAAAVAVGIMPTSLPTDMATVVADRPFAFLIRDSVSGALLFMGRIVHPNG
jgi:serpin B